MLLQLSPDQEFFRDTTARFLDELSPASEVRRLRDDPHGFADEYWRRGADLGWTSLLVDETPALSLIGPVDPAIPTMIMCFYSLLLLFFTIIVLHNVKAVRYKWPIAAALFVAMTFIERGVLWALGPLLGA